MTEWTIPTPKALVRESFRTKGFDKRQALKGAKALIKALHDHVAWPSPENELAMWTAATRFRSVPGHRAFERQRESSAA